jgi:hypothetical protein
VREQVRGQGRETGAGRTEGWGQRYCWKCNANMHRATLSVLEGSPGTRVRPSVPTHVQCMQWHKALHWGLT